MMGISKAKQSVCEQLIEALKSLPEGATWERPWRTLDAPLNGQTGKAYQGINVLVLTVRAWQLGVEGGAWLTYRQAKALGGHVRAGEKGARGLYYKPITGRDEGDEEERRQRFIAKSFTLFHTSQCEDLDASQLHLSARVVASDDPETYSFDVGGLESLIEHMPVTLTLGGDVACWSPVEDRIRMPELCQFSAAQGWWLTFLHELVHASGHQERLARHQPPRALDPQGYAFEELVAELGAAQLGLSFGLTTSHDDPERMASAHAASHAAYIGSWITLLEEQPQALFDAWRLAGDACRWIEALPTAQTAALAS